VLKLGAVLDAWRPKPGPGGDPLAAARSVWPELVGADVARAAQPVAIERDTLIILTTSASWSHQLAFLEPEIVRGLAALPETAAITRLRFRVGKLRRAAAARTPAEAQRARRPVAVEAPAKTLADALARLRRSVERSRAAHRALGAGSARSAKRRRRPARPAAFRAATKSNVRGGLLASVSFSRRHGCRRTRCSS